MTNAFDKKTVIPFIFSLLFIVVNTVGIYRGIVYANTWRIALALVGEAVFAGFAVLLIIVAIKKSRATTLQD